MKTHVLPIKAWVFSFKYILASWATKGQRGPQKAAGPSRRRHSSVSHLFYRCCFLQCFNRFGKLFWKQMAVGVQRQSDRTVSHHLLNLLRVDAKHPDVVKRLFAEVGSWVGTLPMEYIKTEDKDK